MHSLDLSIESTFKNSLVPSYLCSSMATTILLGPSTNANSLTVITNPFTVYVCLCKCLGKHHEHAIA